MKHSIRLFLIPSVLVLFAVSTVHAQAGKVYYDDFSTAKDYLTDGVTGTIWDGLALNNGTATVSTTAVLNALNTNDVAGSLTFSTSNSYWAGDNDNGAFLYRNIAANSDFVLTVKIVGGDWPSLDATAVPYLMAGPLVRRADTISFLAVQAFDQFSVGMGLRSIPATLSSTTSEENWTATNTGGDQLIVKSFPWLKLTKTGTTFTASCSADSLSWFDYQVNVRSDLRGHALQVGLYNATYSSNSGKAVFDNFTLVEYKTSTGINTVNSASESVKAYVINNKIFISGTDKINNVRIASITGATIYENKGLNVSSFNVKVNNPGAYIAIVECSGQSYSKKVIVK